MRKILGVRLLFCKGEINIRRVVTTAFRKMRWLVWECRFVKEKSVILSKKGIEESRRIIAKYGIEDWESLKGESDWPEWLESL